MTGLSRPALQPIDLAADDVPAGVVRYEIEGQWGPHEARHTPRVRRAIRMVFGGYDVAQVDNLLSRAEQAVARGGELQRALARQALRSADLSRRVRGYAREPVHGLIEELSRQLGAGGVTSSGLVLPARWRG